MKIMSSILSLLMIVQGVSGLAFADGNLAETNTKTIVNLKDRALMEELKALTIRKSVTEKYVEDKGNWILGSTLKEIGLTILAADLGGLAGLVLYVNEYERAKQRHKNNLPLTKTQKIMLSDGSASSKLILKSAGVAVALGGALGWLGLQVVNQIENQQISRLKEMDDQQILTEYKDILYQIIQIIDHQKVITAREKAAQ